MIKIKLVIEHDDAENENDVVALASSLAIQIHTQTRLLHPQRFARVEYDVQHPKPPDESG